MYENLENPAKKNRTPEGYREQNTIGLWNCGNLVAGETANIML